MIRRMIEAIGVDPAKASAPQNTKAARPLERGTPYLRTTRIIVRSRVQTREKMQDSHWPRNAGGSSGRGGSAHRRHGGRKSGLRPAVLSPRTPDPREARQKPIRIGSGNRQRRPAAEDRWSGFALKGCAGYRVEARSIRLAGAVMLRLLLAALRMCHMIAAAKIPAQVRTHCPHGKTAVTQLRLKVGQPAGWGTKWISMRRLEFSLTRQWKIGIHG